MRRVLERLFPGCRVQGVEVPSGVAEQPVSLAETRAGAENRARRALEAVPDAQWGVGVEGGVDFDAAGDPWLVTVAAVADRAGSVSEAEGLRLRLPPLFAEALRRGTELEALVERAFGTRACKPHPGAVGYLTRGLVTREALVEATVAAALAPRLFPALYRRGRADCTSSRD